MSKRTKVHVKVRTPAAWIEVPRIEKQWPPIQPDGVLVYAFFINQERYREPTKFRDSKDNRKRCLAQANIIESEIALEKFDYLKTFPNGTKRHRYTTQPSGKMTFQAFCIDIWQPYMRNIVREERTKQEYMEILEQHIWPTLGTIPINELRPEHWDHLIGALKEKITKQGRRLKATRLNKILDRPRQVLMLAAKRKYIADDPSDWIPRQKEPKTDVDPLSREEVKRFLAALPQPTFGLYAGYINFWRIFYIVAFGTGMRPSEQFALTWACIDFTRKQILVRQGFVDGEFTDLKTLGSHRIIDMLPHVETALREHQAHMADKSLYAFPNAHGGLLNVANLRNYVWLPTLKRAGLRLRKPYETRHTFASNALEARVSPPWVSKMLGHSTLKTLFDHYARFIPHDRHDGSALGEWFNG